MKDLIEKWARFKKNICGALIYHSQKVFKIIIQVFPIFLTFHIRPKFSKDFYHQSEIGACNPRKIGLIIQGPLVKSGAFTLESVRLYKKTFKQSVIVLSTWDDEDSRYLEKIKAEEIEIVLSQKPTKPGSFNKNYQIVSSYAGVSRARDLGVKYVLKTRSDQRMYARNIEEFLCNLLRTFSIPDGYSQKERMIGINFNTRKSEPYYLSDMFLFGHVDDMISFWTIPLEDDSAHLLQRCEIIPEVYFTSHFLTRVGQTLEWTVEHSWRMFAKHFCVTDQATLDLYWFKNPASREHYGLFYKDEIPYELMNFRDWLNLYHRFTRRAAD